MQSHFSSQTVPEIFRDLFLGERDGVLVLTREDTEKRVYFDRGLIVFADSNVPEEELGRCLVETGALSAGALEEARSHCGEPSDLARTLVQRDLLGRETLTGSLAEIVARIVQSVFEWQGGTAAFQEGSRPPGRLEGDVLRTVELLMIGIRQIDAFDPIREAMFGLENRIRARGAAPFPVERMRLTPSQGFILSRADGSNGAREILAVLPPEEEDGALRFLFGLLVLGVLEYVPPVGEGAFRVANILRDHADRQALEKVQLRTIEQAYQGLAMKDPYEILGVTPSASREAIDRAYEEAKALFGKDRLLPHLRERFRSELAVIESRLIESYLKVSQADAMQGAPPPPVPNEGDPLTADDLLVRREMDKTRTKLQLEEAARVADDYYAMAKKAMREGDYHNAIQYGKLAISYNKEDARYFFMLADCQGRNPEARWQRMAEENYTRATELDPWNPEYLVRLGRFYKKRGLRLRAIKQFEEALKLSPTHEIASRELKSLR